MILQRLIEYYDRIHERLDDPAPSFGFGRERISFELVIDPNGDNAELNDLRVSLGSRGSKAKALVQGRWMVVPYRGDRSSNTKPNFLWDNPGYIFGRSKKSSDEEKKRLEFLTLHEELLARTNDDCLRAVVQFLSTWNPTEYDRFQLAGEALDQNIVFRIKGAHSFVHDSAALRAEWVNAFRQEIEQANGISLIDGEEGAIPRTHFLIHGVDNAQSTGASLSSFNASAYTSYGLKNSYNSPVSIDQSFRYATALRELLVYEERKLKLGDATVVFWAERPNPWEEYVSEVWGDVPPPDENAPPEDRRRVEQVRLFLSQLREGYAGSKAIEDNNTRFYILGLSPNASRLSVRFWADTTVGEMKSRLTQYMREVDLAGAQENAPPTTLKRMIQATGRAKNTEAKGFVEYDSNAIPPLLSGSIARAVLTGGPYPHMLLTAMVNRVRADGVISHPRVAAIKACLIRNSRLQGKPKEVPVALDTRRSEPSYVMGRLFALLEHIQWISADRKLNSTIKDNYFSAASATPAVVFPRLIRLSQHHLAKLEERQKIYYEKQLGGVVDKLDGFARHLNLEDQGLFTIGYFHQRQDLFTSKKDTQGDTE